MGTSLIHPKICISSASNSVTSSALSSGFPGGIGNHISPYHLKTDKEEEGERRRMMMAKAQPRTLVRLDGRTGEGGGQLVRVAIGLASITGTPVRVDNVRGNREGKRGGGLKAQHAACVMCLAEATDAEVTGCAVGSKSFEYRPRISPEQIKNRNLRVKAESAASILLVFQAVLPFLLFAGDDKGTPISLTIQGGTNVSFSLSYEYLDQVLLPALERFGVAIERKLEFRGWSVGTRQIGSAKFTLHPILPGKTLRAPAWPNDRGNITKIDVSLITPRDVQEPLKKRLLWDLESVFPGIESEFVIIEDSRHASRNYLLLVAHTSTGLRFGRDWLYDGRTKDKPLETICTQLSKKVVKDLDTEVKKGGVVDEYLQDQLIVFQALAEGNSSLPSTSELLESNRERVERTDEPFGDGSLHTTTARWVASQFLPQAKWIDKGRVCEGAGWKTSPLITDEEVAIKKLDNVHIN